MRNELEPGSGTFELRRSRHAAARRSGDRAREVAAAAHGAGPRSTTAPRPAAQPVREAPPVLPSTAWR